MEVICKNIIPLEKQDKTLIDKMYEEREGIVYKAVYRARSHPNGYTLRTRVNTYRKAKLPRANSTVILL